MKISEKITSIFKSLKSNGGKQRYDTSTFKEGTVFELTMVSNHISDKIYEAKSDADKRIWRKALKQVRPIIENEIMDKKSLMYILCTTPLNELNNKLFSVYADYEADRIKQRAASNSKVSVVMTKTKEKVGRNILTVSVVAICMIMSFLVGMRVATTSLKGDKAVAATITTTTTPLNRGVNVIPYVYTGENDQLYIRQERLAKEQKVATTSSTKQIKLTINKKDKATESLPKWVVGKGTTVVISNVTEFNDAFPKGITTIKLKDTTRKLIFDVKMVRGKIYRISYEKYKN